MKTVIGWHINDDNEVKECSANKKSCHYKKHYKTEKEANRYAAIQQAFAQSSKVVRDAGMKTSSPLLSQVDFVTKRPPQIYAFTVDELAEGLHATKVGDTTRGVEVRLREWRQKGGIYKNLKLEFNIDAAFEDEAGQKVYVRDYNFHVWLKNQGYIALTEILDQYPHLQNKKEGISQEFYLHTEDREKKITEAMLRKSLEHQKSMYGKPASPYAYYTEVRGQQVDSHYAPVNSYEMRPFQAEIVGKAIKYFNTTDESDPQFLLSAPTRSGKSFMAANTVSQLFEASPKQNNCVVVVSGFAEIEDEWKATFESHKKFAKEDGKADENICGKSPCECSNKFKYLSVSDLKRDKNSVKKAYEEGYSNVALFLTLQDLSGSTKEDNEVKDFHAFLEEKNSVDFLIGDEAHFAMFSDGRYQESIKLEAEKNEKEQEYSLVDNEVTAEDYTKVGKLLGTMHPTQGKLFVTATPYNNVPWGTKYNQSINAAVIRETDILKEKEKWDADNALKENPLVEWANPSYGIPQKKMFGVNIGMSPTELFRMDGTKFANEEAVRAFIQGFFGASQTESSIPNFFGSKEFADAGLGNHIYATLPSRKACDALEREMKRVFKDRGVEYEVLNISSNNPRHLTSKKRAAEIKDEITRHAEAGKKTITITCNRMGTGVTQEYWDTVLILRTMSSAQQFQQTAGRAGTPRVSSRNNMSEKVRANKRLCRNCESNEIRAIGTYLCASCFEKGGAELEELKKDRVLKHIEKPNVAVVTIDPGQLVKIRHETILSESSADTGSEELEKEAEEELTAIPTYIINGGKKLEMVQLTASNITEHVLANIRNQGVVDMVSDLQIDLSKLDPVLAKKINLQYGALPDKAKFFETAIAEGDHKTHESQNYCVRSDCSEPVKAGLTGQGNPYRLCDEHYDEAKAEKEAEEGNLSDEEIEQKVTEAEDEAYKEAQKDLEARVRNCLVSVLLYATLSKVYLTGVDSILKSHERYDGSKRLARHLDLDIDMMRELRESGVAGIDLDSRIKLMNTLTRETSLNEAWERLTIVLNSFKKLSPNEIPTPEPVAERLTKALRADAEKWKSVAQDGTGVIDLGSKSAVNLLKVAKEAADAGVDIKDKLWSIPTSGKTFELTRRVYLAHGWDDDKIIFHDNLNNMETVQLVHAMLESKKCQAADRSKCQYHGRGVAGMKALNTELEAYRKQMEDDSYYHKLLNQLQNAGRFDFCISNPPYQRTPAATTQNKSRDIYSEFVVLGSKISDVSVMIHPVKAFRKIPVVPTIATRQILENPEFDIEMVENDTSKCFPTVDIKGGVMITRYEKGSDNKPNWDKVGIPEVAYKIMEQVRSKDEGRGSVSDITFSAFNYTAEACAREGLTKDRYVQSNHPGKVSLLLDSPPAGEAYITVYGRRDGKRVKMYALKKDIDLTSSDKVKGYKILLAGGTRDGSFGDKLSETIVTTSNSVSTRTFKNIGPFKTKKEAQAAEKYLKTRFARMLLSTLKITQNTPEHVFANIPNQDFTSDSSINWSGTVAEIDKQLADKYELTPAQREWLKANVQEME